MEQRTSQFPWRIWLLCLLSFACFYTREQNSNITTRSALTLSILHRHELTIDAYAPYTIDKAEIGPHTYADKAPGLSLLALPVTAAMDAVAPLPDDPMVPPGKDVYNPRFATYLVILTLSTVGLLTATAAGFLFRWCRRREISAPAATFAAIAYAFGTPLFGWSTIFFGHAAAGALLLIGFVLLSDANDTGGSRLRLWYSLLAGLTLGTAFATEFTSGPAVAVVGICCAAQLVWRGQWNRLFSTYALAAIGLLLPVVILAGYNQAAFGSAMHLGYADVQDFPGMQKGFFGLVRPSPKVALSLIFGVYRGLLPLAPILVLAPFGFLLCLREPRFRLVAIVGALVFLWYWTMNSSYYYWSGGYSTGPRHLMPGLCLLTIPLAVLWDRAVPVIRWLALALLTYGACVSAIAASVTMAAPEWMGNPLLEMFLPALQRGDLQRFVTSAFGLSGFFGIALLLAIWVVVGGPAVLTLVRSARHSVAQPAFR